jgi:hypothetical protein
MTFVSAGGGVRAMQCLWCGGKMHLIAVTDDQDLVLPGYLPHMFQCAACNGLENRLLFTRERPAPGAPTTELQAAPKQATPTQAIRMSAGEQAIAKLRNHQVALSGKDKVRRAAERASEFNRQWDGFRSRSKSSSGLRRGAGADTLWARAVAKLRPVPGSER